VKAAGPGCVAAVQQAALDPPPSPMQDTTCHRTASKCRISCSRGSDQTLPDHTSPQPHHARPAAVPVGVRFALSYEAPGSGKVSRLAVLFDQGVRQGQVHVPHHRCHAQWGEQGRGAAASDSLRGGPLEQRQRRGDLSAGSCLPPSSHSTQHKHKSAAHQHTWHSKITRSNNQLQTAIDAIF
jgi:hypothetical protein